MGKANPDKMQIKTDSSIPPISQRSGKAFEDAPTDLQLAAVEYNALRAEVLARLGHQNTAILGCLASLVALAGTWEKLWTGQPLIPGLLSLVYFMVGWYLLSHDRQIAEIGYYLENNLRKYLLEKYPDKPWLFGWESRIHFRDFSGLARAMSTARALAIYGPTYFPGLVLLFWFYTWNGQIFHTQWWAIKFTTVTAAWERVILTANLAGFILGVFSCISVTRIYRSIAQPTTPRKPSRSS